MTTDKQQCAETPDIEELLRQRKQLEAEIGTADAAAIIAMIRSMEEQLNSIYEDIEED